MIKDRIRPDVRDIVFDCFGVLFFINKNKILSRVGKFRLLYYLIKNFENPFNQVFRILDAMRTHEPGEYQNKVAYKGNYIPKTLSDWQRGYVACEDALEKMILYVKKYCAERRIGKNNQMIYEMCARISFDPELIVTYLDLNTELIKKIIKKKKEQKHRFFILSNMDKSKYRILKTHYPEIFALFDGIVASGESGLVKPDADIFEYLFNRFDIDPEKAVLIDDQEENIVAAQNAGMQGILFTCNADLHL